MRCFPFLLAAGLASQVFGLLGMVARGVELTADERQRLSDLEGRKVHQLTNVEFADYLQLRGRSFEGATIRAHPREDVGVFAKRALGQPFRLNAVQFDLAESDCVSFVNSMLAMSIAPNWQSYTIIIERIRHKDGIVEYRNRNFETLADWIPNNAWLLQDVTEELGPADNRAAQPFKYVVRPKVFVDRPSGPEGKQTRTVFSGFDKKAAPEIRTGSYIPADRVKDVLADLRTGDVVIVLVTDGEYLRTDHHALIVREPDGVSILHSTKPSVRQDALEPFLKRCHWIAGFKFLRLRENAREIAAQEVSRFAPKISVLSPADQDAKNGRWRAARLAAASQPAK